MARLSRQDRRAGSLGPVVAVGVTGIGLLVARAMLRKQKERSIIRLFSQSEARFSQLFLGALTGGTGWLPSPDLAMVARARRDPVGFVRALVQEIHEAIQWVSDRDIWGVADYWQSPQDTVEMGTGDCEDQALLVYHHLWRAGFRDAELVVGTLKGEGHAWVEMPSLNLLLEPTSGSTFRGRPGAYCPAIGLNPRRA